MARVESPVIPFLLGPFRVVLQLLPKLLARPRSEFAAALQARLQFGVEIRIAANSPVLGDYQLDRRVEENGIEVTDYCFVRGLRKVLEHAHERRFGHHQLVSVP